MCETPGIPGREERLREIVRRELAPMVDEVRVDRLGNLIGHRKGPGGRKLMVAAHMDEIGFLVRGVEEPGLLRLHVIGGHDPRNMVAQRVLVCGREDLPGVLYPSMKPHHLQKPEDRDRVPQVGEFFVDVGLPMNRVQQLVPIGSMVVIQRDCITIGDTISCKALDDRVCVYMMIEAMKRCEKIDWDLYLAATAQEEVGVRGAAGAAHEIQPDVGLALDVTIANDLPGIVDHERITCLGRGAAIKIMDSFSISSVRMVDALRDLAEKHGVPHQMEILPFGGTDAGGMQRSRGGVAAGTLSIPTRYIHSSVEMIHKDDLEACIRLLTCFIQEGHKYGYEAV